MGAGSERHSICLSVCNRCKPDGWRGGDNDRPGKALAARVAGILAGHLNPALIPFREIHCLSQCKRPCVVAFSGENRFTYLFGDLQAERDASAVVEAFLTYARVPEGFMQRSERPVVMQAGILGRIPPLNSTHEIVTMTGFSAESGPL